METTMMRTYLLRLLLMATCLWAIGCLDDDTTIQSGEIDPVPRRGSEIAKTDQEFTLDPKALMAGKTTIALMTYRNTEHAKAAKWLRDTTIKHTGWKDVYAVTYENESVVYRGRYKSAAQARRELKGVRAYTTKIGKVPFAQASVVSLPGQDGGNPEWDLARVTDKMYSVLVAVYMDMPAKEYYGRRQRAVAACKALREKGVEAYYYHTPSRSALCIGSFGPSAVRSVKQKRVHPQTGDVSHFTVKQPVDPKLKKIRRDYPHILICGNTEINEHWNKTTQKMDKKISPTTIIAIPSSKQRTNPHAPSRTTTGAGNAEPRKTQGTSKGTGWMER
jgi:hypothetical protein